MTRKIIVAKWNSYTDNEYDFYRYFDAKKVTIEDVENRIWLHAFEENCEGYKRGNEIFADECLEDYEIWEEELEE